LGILRPTFEKLLRRGKLLFLETDTGFGISMVELGREKYLLDEKG
jgi:hypothetical protein